MQCSLGYHRASQRPAMLTKLYNHAHFAFSPSINHFALHDSRRESLGTDESSNSPSKSSIGPGPVILMTLLLCTTMCIVRKIQCNITESLQHHGLLLVFGEWSEEWCREHVTLMGYMHVLHIACARIALSSTGLMLCFRSPVACASLE